MVKHNGTQNTVVEPGGVASNTCAAQFRAGLRRRPTASRLDDAVWVGYRSRMNTSLFCLAAALIGIVEAKGWAEDSLVKNGSFELPKVEGQTDQKKGGNPVDGGPDTSWAHFLSMDAEGRISVGLINGLGRTGAQSLYVDFKKAKAANEAFLMTELIPVKPREDYHISMWGLIDRKRPLTLDQGRPILRVEVEFFQSDQESDAGETEYRTQMIPGSARRILFNSSAWSEYFTDVKSPEGAEFMKISFRWQSPVKGEIADGMIYFDDVVVTGPRGALLPSDDPSPSSPSTPETPADPAQAPAPTTK